MIEKLFPFSRLYHLIYPATYVIKDIYIYVYNFIFFSFVFKTNVFLIVLLMETLWGSINISHTKHLPVSF